MGIMILLFWEKLLLPFSNNSRIRDGRTNLKNISSVPNVNKNGFAEFLNASPKSRPSIDLNFFGYFLSNLRAASTRNFPRKMGGTNRRIKFVAMESYGA